MNTKNNKRKKESRQKIENAFMQLLDKKEVKEITVKEICLLAHVNRTTFYVNYLDVYDLIEQIGKNLLDNFYELYQKEEIEKYNSNDFTKLFHHIQSHQQLYKTYFKLGLEADIKILRYDIDLANKYYNNKHIRYHTEYFRAGITAIIKIWLEEGCKLSPEELFDIIKEEYANKH